MAKPKLKDAIAQIKQSGGFISTAAAKLGCSRTTLHAMVRLCYVNTVAFPVI